MRESHRGQAKPYKISVLGNSSLSRIYVVNLVHQADNPTMTSTSVNFLRLSALACCLSLCLAGPRYIAIPIDGVDVIELNPMSASPVLPPSRLPRQTEAYVPVAVSSLQHSGEALLEPQPRAERATAHILDYVDFGSHTGPNGAFSWYADYPSQH